MWDPETVTGAADDLVRPRDFDARYGDGLGLGVSLGGGGLWFVAWQVAYLSALSERGVDLAGADRVVGTSAGSIVASMLDGDRLARFHREVSMLAKVPKLLGALAPAGELHPSQERASACSDRPRTPRPTPSAPSVTRL